MDGFVGSRVRTKVRKFIDIFLLSGDVVETGESVREYKMTGELTNNTSRVTTSHLHLPPSHQLDHTHHTQRESQNNC